MAIDDNNNSAWKMAIGGTFAGAAGYAYLKNKKMLSDAWRMGNTDIIGQTVEQARDITGFASVKTPAVGNVFDESMAASISGLQRSRGLNETIAEIHGSTYRALMKGGQVSHEGALAALAGVSSQKSAVSAYKAGLSAVQQYSGDIGIFNTTLSKVADQGTGFAGAGLSPGGFGISSRQGFLNLQKLNPAAQANALRIQQGLSDLGIEDVAWRYQNIQDVVGGQTKLTPMMSGYIGNEMVASLPLENTGLTYSGKNLNVRHITRKGYDKAGRIMSYPEMYEQAMLNSVAKAQTTAQLKKSLLNSHQSLIEQMNMRDSSARAAAVWTSPFMTSGGLANARLTAQQAVATGKMTEDEIIGLLGRGLYPYVSPNAAASGTLTTRNLAEELYGDLGAFLSASDRPTQFVRGEWGVTEKAKQLASPYKGTFGQKYSRLERKLQGPMYKRFMYGKGVSPLSSQAYTAPQLMTFYAKPATKGYGTGFNVPALNQMLAPEEGLISNRVGGMMEYERIVQKRIALDKGFMVNKDIAAALSGKKPGEVVSLDLGMDTGFVGIERGTGKEVLTGAGKGKFSIVGAELTANANEATVYMKERRKLTQNEMWKFFSEENKFMAAAADETKMRSVLRAAGMGDTVNIAGQQVEAIFSGKLVGRNKMAQLTQQIEAISMFASQKIDSGALLANPEVMAFLDDPTAALNTKSILAKGVGDADYQIQKNLFGMAKQWGFSNKEMQLTFGMTDRDTLSQLARSGSITWREAGQIARSPGVIGLGKGMLGDIATEGGAGGLGSFEPTGFRALAMKGTAGQRYAAELAQRITGKGELVPADKMAASILGQEGILQKFGRDKSSLASIMSGDIVQQQGRYVSLGRKFSEFGGSDVLYIPGVSEAPELMKPKFSKGDLIDTPIAKELEGFRKTMRMVNDGKATQETLDEAAIALRKTVMQHTEAQSYAGGKIMGSKYLTGQRVNFTKDPDVFRISPRMGEDMFEDLIGKAKTTEQISFLQAQRETFRKGEPLVGGMWRHPTTGPESFQFVKFKQDKNIVDNMVAAPTKFGKLSMQDGRVMDIDLSEMVGFKGDFDNDKYTISLISDRMTEGKVRRNIARQGQEQYNQYLFNHYTMKDMMENRISKSGELKANAFAEGFRKLSSTKTATGQVNVALQRLKLGIQYSAPEKYRPLAELFYHLEESAISKHSVLGADVYQAIGQSVQEGGERGTKRLQSVIEALMGEQPRTIQGAIIGTGGAKSLHKLDYNPKQWAEQAMSAYGTVTEEVEATMKAARVAKGKVTGEMGLDDYVRMYNMRKGSSVDVAQAVMQETSEAAGSFSARAARATTRAQVKARSMFGAFRQASKPLLAATGLAAGLMLLAPSTSSVLRSPEGAHGGRNVDPENYLPQNGGGMNPPRPGMNMSPSIYSDGGGGRRITHANIRMQTGDLNSSSRNFMRSARELSNGGSVNIRTRDDRSALDARMLANKIHERL